VGTTKKETIKEFIKLAEEQGFEELKLPPSAFKDLKEAPGWRVIERIIAGWISVRRDDLEIASVGTEEERVAFARVQGAIDVLRNVLLLPDALGVDSEMEEENENESE